MKRMLKSWLLAAAVGIGASGLTAAAALAADHTLKVGWTTGDSANDPYAIGARAFKEEVERRSDGRIEVHLFPNRALGDEKAMLEGMRLGTVDMAVMSSAVNSQVVPEFALTDLPFLFANEKQARAVLDGPVGAALAEKVKDKGLMVLSYMEGGFRNLVNNVRPINTPADMAGVKFRVIQSPIYIEMVESLGGNAVPMAWGEVYTAVQQGTIDGLEAPPSVIEQNKFAEVVKYLSMSNHTYSALEFMISKRRFDALPEDLRAIVQEAATAAGETQRQRSYEIGQDVLAVLEQQGMTINTIDDLKPFQKAVAPIYEKYRGIVGSDLLDAALETAASVE